jgi:N-acetylmuramoyl-L-alanine amidase
MRPIITIRALVLAALLAAAPPPHAARADAPPADALQLTSLRSWTAPTNTRVVLDFSAPVTFVMPDSGVARRLVVSAPGERLARPDGVPARLVVRDGAVDSVEAVLTDDGATFTFWLSDSVAFRAFTLAAMEDKPFRLVVDVQHSGGGQAEERRLAGIAAAKRRDRVRVVAIDAGHGGDDTGAHGPGGVLEKNVNLAIARALAVELGQVPGVRAVLTRDRDYFIPLRERYHIAEKVKADLFISIHANSTRRRGSGSGTEVYFLSLRGATDQADADLADLENAADMVGGVPVHAEDDLVSILYDVKRASALEQSQLLAETLLDHIAAGRRLESRGVKQAGFAVLKSVEFPSTLVETAFINNPVEARLLKNPDFQKQMGRQLALGVRTFLERTGALRGAASPGGGTSEGVSPPDSDSGR